MSSPSAIEVHHSFALCAVVFTGEHMNLDNLEFQEVIDRLYPEEYALQPENTGAHLSCRYRHQVTEGRSESPGPARLNISGLNNYFDKRVPCGTDEGEQQGCLDHLRSYSGRRKGREDNRSAGQWNSHSQ